MPKSESTRPFFKSLLGQMVLATVLPATVVLGTVVTFDIMHTYDQALEDEKVILVQAAETVATHMNARNREGLLAADMVAAAQRGGLFGQRELTVRALRTALDANPTITGLSIAYEPNADGNDVATLPASGTQSSGRFLPYWYRDWRSNDRVAFKAVVGMDDSLYYLGPKENWERRQDSRPMMTEPYEYDGQLMVEHACPIIIDGKFKGAITADRSLSDLQTEINGLAEELKLDIYIVSTKGKVVVASNGTQRPFISAAESWRTKPIDETPQGINLKKMITEHAAGTSEVLNDPATRGRSFFAAAPIAAGNWMAVVATAESTVTAPIISDAYRSCISALIGVTIIALVIYFPTRLLAQRIDQAAKAAEQVAAGDLTRVSTKTTRGDETGDLFRALDSMTDDLNSLVGQVREASVELSSTATELATTSRKQDEVVASFGASSTQIAAAVREINATGQELSREMEHVNDVATSTSKLAQDGRVQLETMEGAMQSLDHATTGVADRLAAINEKAVNIGGVVTTITKVAEQTNLLSVNAAIEAEKAGEYGRGFLVVAREIRRLADQTGQATLDIERMVKEMQGAVSSGVMEMDRFSEQVRRNVTDVRTIGRSMSDIIGSVDESSRSFGTVREGMRSQSSGAGQISEAMTTLTSNAKASAEAVKEFSRASDILQRSIGMLKTAIAAFQLRA